MALSKQSVETLMDLVEIKISYMDVLDRDDAKELRVLERCRDELKAATSALTAEWSPSSAANAVALATIWPPSDLAAPMALPPGGAPWRGLVATPDLS